MIFNQDIKGATNGQVNSYLIVQFLDFWQFIIIHLYSANLVQDSGQPMSKDSTSNITKILMRGSSLDTYEVAKYQYHQSEVSTLSQEAAYVSQKFMWGILHFRDVHIIMFTFCAFWHCHMLNIMPTSYAMHNSKYSSTTAFIYYSYTFCIHSSFLNYSL